MVRRTRTALAALLAAGLLAVIAANVVDQRLEPNAAALLEQPRRILPDEDNAWFMLVGLAAAPEENALAFGREWTAAALEVRTERDLESFDQRFAPRRIPIPATATAPQTPHLGLVLKRYEALYQYKGFEEPVLRSLHSPLPYGPEYGYAWAKERTLEKALLNREFRPALKALWEDTDLQRRMLEGSAYLVSKTVFAVALGRNYLVASAMIRASPGNATGEVAALRELLSPLKPAELDMQRAIASEVRLRTQLARDAAFPRGLFTRPNAVANAGEKAVRAEFAEILLRMDDLEALRKLVAAQLEAVVSRTVPPLAEPLRLDRGKQQLYFEPKSARFREFGSDGRIAVVVPPS